MTIGIDVIGTHLGSGTKTYNLNFCDYLSKQNLNEKIYIFTTSKYINSIDKNINSKICYIIKPAILSNIFFRIIWMQIFLPFELKKLKISKFYSPMNMGPIFLKFFKIKFILALHSNLPWVYFDKMPGNYLRNIFTKYLMELSIYSCDKLIVDSEFAKDEIVKKLDINKNKVSVVYLGIDKKYLSQSKNDYFIKDFEYKNYILSVLSCVKYHNIINLLKSFKLLKKEKADNLKFVLVVQILDKKYFSEIKDFISKNFSKDDVILFHDLDNNYLVNLYQKASFYIFSSYCEVFGLTSLEAMSQGCPVLISKKSAMPEVNSDAAEYFDPDDENQIKDSMNKILSNLDYRNELINKGHIHSKKFNWTNTVSKTLRILEE